ncbi:hypothetical protein HYY72_04080 [Candidatus Woesearchaeota archaeon]|nr:hypothetical protein [Candidatus Woesearchaeota archaeon]
MISANYQRGRYNASLFTGLKRFVVTAASIAAVAYAGAKTDFDQKLDGFINGQRQVAEGYAAVTLQRKIARDGSVEFYMGYNDGKNELPVLQGVKGPQAGGIEYVIQNTDFSKLTQAQASQLAEKGLERMGPDKKADYLAQKADFSRMSQQQAFEYARKSWDFIEPKQKYELVKAELERLLNQLISK